MNKIDEQAYTAQMMLNAAESGTNLSLRLAAWFIGGCGGALSLLFVNLEITLKFVPLSVFKSSATLIAFAVLLHVVQRYLSTIVLAATQSAKSAKEEELQFSEDFSFDRVFEEIENATMWPGSVFVRKVFSSIRSGDYTAHAKVFYKLAQIQGWVAVAQILLGAAAILTVIFGAQA